MSPINSYVTYLLLCTALGGAQSPGLLPAGGFWRGLGHAHLLHGALLHRPGVALLLGPIPRNRNILAIFLLESLTVDHILCDIMTFLLCLAHGVVHSLTLHGALLRAVWAEVSLADLHLLVDGDVLVVDGAGLLELLVTFLLLMRLEFSDVGGVAHLLGLVDAGHHLGVLCVFCQHHFLDAQPAILVHSSIHLDFLDRI